MIVSLDAIFSVNSKIGSKIIANGSAHLAPNCPKTSHTALLVNKRWVHESTGHSGVAVLSVDNWSKQHTLVAQVSLAPREYQEIAGEFRRIQGRSYDYLGVFYLGIWIFLSFFGATLPAKNMWQDKSKYFCCEALAAMTGHDYSMMAPVQILAKLEDV